MQAIQNKKFKGLVEVYEHFIRFHKNSTRMPVSQMNEVGKVRYLTTHQETPVVAAPNRSFARMAKKGVQIGNNRKGTKCRVKMGSLIQRKIILE